jgi:hypothetical protein
MSAARVPKKVGKRHSWEKGTITEMGRKLDEALKRMGVPNANFRRPKNDRRAKTRP